MDNQKALEQIEATLQDLVASDKSSWVKIYELMEKVDNEKMYAGKYRSYTAWVNEFATKAKVHVSLLWSRKKAGKMYAEYAARAADRGELVADVHEINCSPDNFVLIEKIAGSNTAVADDLTKKVIEGNLGRKDLKNAWATVKAERSKKGEKSVRVNAYDKSSSSLSFLSEEGKEKGKEEREDKKEKEDILLSASDIVLSLRDREWIPGKIEKSYQQDKYNVMTEFSVQTGTSRHARRIDALVIENMTPVESNRISMHGIEIKVDKSDLLGDHKMQEYIDFVDFFWLAVPETLIKEAKSIIADGWGILSISLPSSEAKNKPVVVVPAKRQNPIFREKTLEAALNKLL